MKQGTVYGIPFVAILWAGCTMPMENSLEQAQMHSVTPEPTQKVEVPVPGPIGGYGSLPYWIDQAFQNNPDTKRVWAQARVAAARKGQAESAYYPTIGVSTQAVRSHTSAVVGQTNTTSQATQYIPSVELSYKLFQFGADKAAADAARDTLYAAYRQYDRNKQTLLYAVQQAYYNLYQAKAMVESCMTSEKDAEASYQAALKKAEAGLANNQDVLRAKANLLEATYQLENARSQVEGCRATLAQAVGLPVSTDIRIEKPNIPAADKALVVDVEKLMSSVLSSRPDVLAARASLQAAEKTEKAKRLQFLSEIGLSASASKVKTKGVSGAPNNYSGAVVCSWNIFNGLDSTYALLEARAQKEAARQDVRQAEILVSAEVWTAYHAFQSAKRQLESAVSLEAASNETFQAIQVGYSAGINSVLDLLSAQKDLSDARQSKIKAETQLALTLAELACVTGGLAK